jgi:uncharacterized phage infection (PIP) family protein YhgE
LVIQWVLLDMAIVYNFAQLDIMHLQNKWNVLKIVILILQINTNIL